MLERISEQLYQIETVIEILKDARPLCEDATAAGMVASALGGAETLQNMMLEAQWPALPEDLGASEDALSSSAGAPGPTVDFAEFCFPV